jgi:hypothetical protein
MPHTLWHLVANFNAVVFVAIQDDNETGRYAAEQHCAVKFLFIEGFSSFESHRRVLQ